MTKANEIMTYEEFEKKCYELAEQEPDPEYAKECLDFSKKMGGIKRLYNQGESLESAMYLLCF